MSDKIPTAEEFLKNSNNIDYSKLNWPDTRLDIKPFVEADLIQFAQLHVEAALKAASEKGLVCLEDLNKEGKPINSMEAKEINTSSNFNINGGIINGHVGTNISGEYNYFSSVESACKEANLSIEQIEKIKSLFENKDKHGLINFFQGMASETLGVILGYLTLGQFGFFKQH